MKYILLYDKVITIILNKPKKDVKKMCCTRTMTYMCVASFDYFIYEPSFYDTVKKNVYTLKRSG